MKHQQILFAALITSVSCSFAASWTQIGDDGNPNTQNNGAYVTQKGVSVAKAIYYFQ